MENLKGVREFCESGNQLLRNKWNAVCRFGLKISILELENALRAINGEALLKRDNLYTNFRNAFSELREAGARYGIYIPDIKPEDIATLLR